MKYFIALTMLALFPSEILAQDPQETLKKYITKNEIYIQNLDDKLRDVFQYTFPDCEKKINITRLKPKNLLETEISKTQSIMMSHPIKGQWVESAIGTACDQSSQLNLLLTAHDENKLPLMYPLINGRTKIEPLTQSKAEKIVYQQIINTLNCRSTKTVINTTFLGYKSKNNNALTSENENLGWFEQWNVDACGKIEAVNVAIIPDPKTKYSYVAKVKQ